MRHLSQRRQWVLSAVVLLLGAASIVSSYSRLGGWRIARPRKRSYAGAGDVAAAAHLHSERAFFFAANLHNSAGILPQFADELLRLCSVLGTERVFVSIYENGECEHSLEEEQEGGVDESLLTITLAFYVRILPRLECAGSTDDTPSLLSALRGDLTALGVRSAVVTESTSWRTFCNDTAAPVRCLQDSCAGGGVLRDCSEGVRIPVMAAIRNKALLPLRDPASGVPNEPLTLIFLNDILLHAADIVELLSTNGGEFDTACGMDFEELKLYDTWVARDLSGATLSEYYPFFREATAQEMLRRGLPARVYSCWNGAVAMQLSREEAVRLSFRSWAESEPRSPLVAAGPSLAISGGSSSGTTWNEDFCAASECLLVCRDAWAEGRRLIFMNPRVRLFYNAKTQWMQALIAAPLNTLFFSWANRISSPHHSLRSARIRAVVGTLVPWGGGVAISPPASVACGLSGQDALTSEELRRAKHGL